MKANIKNVQRLLRTAHAHYSPVRPDVEGGMVGANRVGEVSGIRAWTSELALPNQNIVQVLQVVATYHYYYRI